MILTKTYAEAYMRPVIRKCTVADLEQAPNLRALLAEYAAESAVDGLGPHDPQMETYHLLEDSGALHVLAAFQRDELIGFLLMLVSVLPHFGKRVATTESFFVASAARSSGAGLRLLSEAERHSGFLGCVGILVCAPIGGMLEQILPHVGYRETNRVFFKGLPWIEA